MINSRYNLVSIGDFLTDVKRLSSRNGPSDQHSFEYIDISSIDREKKRIAQTQYTLASEAPSRARQIVNPNDVLVSTVRPNLNAVAVVPSQLRGAIASTGYCILRPRPEELNYRYLYHWVRTNYFVSEMVQQATGASYPAVSDSIVRESSIPLPPLVEQNRIADILDKADAIRRKREEELDTLASLRASAFLNLFGDPRTEQIEWERVTLGDVTILDAPMVDPREPEHIDLIHLGPDRIERNTGRLLPALTAREESLISGKFLFDERYLLYSKIRPYLRKVALPNFRGLCSADVYPIRPVEGVATREYLFSLLISEAFLSYTTTLASRASIPKLNRKELAAYTFYLPPLELQEEYSAFLQRHQQYTARFERAKLEADRLFNSLAQRAFKGEL